MSNLLLLVHECLTFTKTYFLPLLVAVAVCAAAYGRSIRNAAWSDIRNPGIDFLETQRLGYLIFLERRSKRDWPTMSFCYGLPPIILLLALSLIYG